MSNTYIARFVALIRGSREMNSMLQKVNDMLYGQEGGGEVMVRLESGQVEELHQHDTTVDDHEGLIKAERSDGVLFIDGGRIEAVWIHQSSLPE